MPVNAVVPERKPAVAKAATAENMSGSKPAAMDYGATTSETAAVKDRATAAEPAMETSAATAMVTAAAMAAAAISVVSPCDAMFSCRHRTRIDQRQRLRALAWHRRQRKAARRRQDPGTQSNGRCPRLGSGIFIMREISLNSGQRKPGPRDGLLSAHSFAIAPDIKLEMTT